VNKNTGLIEDLKVNNELILQSGPYINLKLSEEKGRSRNIRMEDYAKTWKLKDFNFEMKNGIAIIKSKGFYNKISVAFTIQIDEGGLLDIAYKITNAPSDINIHEVGIKFYTGNAFSKLAWNRNSYFTAYPKNDIGAPTGEVNFSMKPQMHYREKPEHSWGLDSNSFFYFGLGKEFPYTNIVRSLKENIYSYVLSATNSKVEVLSDGKQACRFDKINGVNTLIVNDLWDYNSLRWGNYSKRIKLEKIVKGRVILLCN